MKAKSMNLNFPGKERLETLISSLKKRARTVQAQRLLYMFVALESIIIPVPADPLMAAFIVANREKWLRITFYCAVASVLGGAGGWLLGWGMGETAKSIITAFSLSGSEDKFLSVSDGFQQYGLLLIFIGAFTPLPYKVIAISAGLFGFGLLPFILISIVGRGLRFILVAMFVVYFRDLRFLAALTTCFGALVLLGFFLVSH